MKTKNFFLLVWICCCGIPISTTAHETIVAQTTDTSDDDVKPEILVTNDGDVIQVFNLDYSSADFCYYTLSTDTNADLKRIAKKDVMIIKLSDGSKIDPSIATTITSVIATNKPESTSPQTITHALNNHPDVTYQATEVLQDKQGKDVFVVTDDQGRTLYMQKVAGEDKTLEVIKPTGKMKEYKASTYIIPEFVLIDGERYTVKYIGEKAFYWENVHEIQFPNTLVEIRANAFRKAKLKNIILPESIQTIGPWAFIYNNLDGSMGEIYIPKGISYIGHHAFLYVGCNRSPRGYTQACISCIPDFVTTGNCNNCGIDEEAVEDYWKIHK